MATVAKVTKKGRKAVVEAQGPRVRVCVYEKPGPTGAKFPGDLSLHREVVLSDTETFEFEVEMEPTRFIVIDLAPA